MFSIIEDALAVVVSKIKSVLFAVRATVTISGALSAVNMMLAEKAFLDIFRVPGILNKLKSFTIFIIRFIASVPLNLITGAVTLALFVYFLCDIVVTDGMVTRLVSPIA